MRKISGLDFDEALEYGQHGEKIVKKILESKYGFTDIQFNNNKDYDLSGLYKAERYYFEVKFDLVTKRTGNLMIEFEDRGKPSGIFTSKADYYVWVLSDDDKSVWLIRSDLLKDVIRFLPKIEIRGGEEGCTKLYFIKFKHLQPYLKKL